MSRDDVWRVMPLSVDDVARQLALSEAIVEAVGSGGAPPTARVYVMDDPTVVLGVGQRAGDVDLDAIRASDWRLARRLSGGTAVYHDRQSISVERIVPTGHMLAPGSVHDAMERFARIVAAMVGALGAESRLLTIAEARASRVEPGLEPVCFAAPAPFEVVDPGGRKLAGLAQVRRRAVVLHHAALYVTFDAERSARMIRSARDEAERARLRAALNAVIGDLMHACGRVVGPQDVEAALASTLEGAGWPQVASGPEPHETERAGELAELKYRNDARTFRR